MHTWLALMIAFQATEIQPKRVPLLGTSVGNSRLRLSRERPVKWQQH